MNGSEKGNGRRARFAIRETVPEKQQRERRVGGLEKE